MSFKIKPLHPLFAAEVTGFDFSAAPEKMPIAEILAAIDKYGVLAFRNATPPTDEQHVAFSRMLGPIERGKLIKVTGHARLRLALPELVDEIPHGRQALARGHVVHGQPRDLFAAARP
jgi:alpha-ketoglutarate-dependent 2,4-dichlorophenoxyacetate dioxygenase